MELEELVDRFVQMEDEMNLFQKEIKHVRFWERIRVNVKRDLQEKKGITESSQDFNNGFRDQLNKILRMMRNLFIKNPLLAPNSDIFFWGHSRRKKRNDGLWWDIYSDPVIEEIRDSYSYVYTEKPQLNGHKTPTKTGNIFYMDFVVYAPILLYKLGIGKVKLSDDEQNYIKELEKKIEQEFGVNMQLEDLIIRKLSLRNLRKPLLKIILKKINPSLALMVVSYGDETFVEACKELDIPVAELQHGSLGKNHLAYSYPGERTKRTFPDYFLSFGSYWRKKIEWPIPDERIIDVGWLYYQDEKAKYENLETKDQIVFISQRSIGNKLSDFAMELNQEESLDSDIVFKLHPFEFCNWQDKYPDLKDSDIEVLRNEKPLYQIFAESKAQVGVYSTALYEGLGFGLETFILDMPYSSTFCDTDDIQIIDSPKNIDLTEATNSTSEKYFSGKHNIEHALKKITE